MKVVVMVLCVLCDVVEVIPPTHTPSPDSASDLMTCLMQDCEVAHRGFRSEGGWRITPSDRW